MESRKKKSKSSTSKAAIPSESSDSDNSYTEDEEDDDDDLTDNEDEIRSSDEDDCLLDDINFDYMTDVVKLLEDHADVSMENSIILNRNLQDKLEILRAKIISMINKCREIYQENHLKLTNPTAVTSYLKGIGSCGRPFFKDTSGRSCPPNEDYLYRSDVEKEFFPSDLELYPHFTWTAKDKVVVLQGIKEQAIDYIERKESYANKIKKTRETALGKKVKLHTLKIKKLLDKVDDEFSIDWNQVSVYDLGSRHTANSCYAIWNVYLKPELNRNEWTEEENIKLNELAKKYKFQDWIAIASEMKNRSDYQCFVQYQTVVSVKMREDKGERWSKEEDDLLLSLVEKYRMGNVIRWNPICSQFPNRSKRQCFARYKYSINPTISRAPFTPEEDCIILAAVEEFGENFNCFPKELFPNRTVVQIRNRYNNSIKNRDSISHWTPEDDEFLLGLVAKYGKHDWKTISKEVTNHTRTSCRTRYLTIEKFFKENPNATVKDIPRKRRKVQSTVTKSNWVETITNLKEDRPLLVQPRDPSKDLYRYRLRKNELQWYNFLKYSYDYKFGEGYYKLPHDGMASLEFVRCVFDIDLRMPVVLSERYTHGIVQVSLEKLIRLHQQDEKALVFQKPHIGYKLPPSYCTLMAFRGLCIQASFTENEDTSVLKRDQWPDDVCEARHKFHQRLLSLLYKTTLLSRLEPQTSVEQNHFKVIFDTSTVLGNKAGITLAELKLAQTNKIADNLLIARQKADLKRQYEEKLMKLGKMTRNEKKLLKETQKSIGPATVEGLEKDPKKKKSETVTAIAKNLKVATLKACKTQVKKKPETDGVLNMPQINAIAKNLMIATCKASRTRANRKVTKTSNGFTQKDIPKAQNLVEVQLVAQQSSGNTQRKLETQTIGLGQVESMHSSSRAEAQTLPEVQQNSKNRKRKLEPQSTGSEQAELLHSSPQAQTFLVAQQNSENTKRKFEIQVIEVQGVETMHSSPRAQVQKLPEVLMVLEQSAESTKRNVEVQAIGLEEAVPHAQIGQTFPEVQMVDQLNFENRKRKLEPSVIDSEDPTPIDSLPLIKQAKLEIE